MREIRPDEISSLLKERIKNYDNVIRSDDVGYVISVGDGIANVQGIDKAMASELLEFPNDKSGRESTWPFNKKFYLTLNLAWGGDWGGYAGVDENALPCTMKVDYVRVYKK